MGTAVVNKAVAPTTLEIVLIILHSPFNLLTNYTFLNFFIDNFNSTLNEVIIKNLSINNEIKTV